jgi:hypothetical protein
MSLFELEKIHDTKEFHAHSDILRARSQYFKKKNVIYRPPDASTPYLSPNVTPSTFQKLLSILWT